MKILNLVVLGVVLWADLGTREITWRRVLRSVIVSAIAVAIFLRNPQTAGNGLALELIGLASGLILGAIGSRRLMVFKADPRAEEPISTAGAGYAAFWIVDRHGAGPRRALRSRASPARTPGAPSPRAALERPGPSGTV